jgi:tetratricopeptide (TPR) repeat protein
MWVSNSYEDIYARAESNLVKGEYEAAYQDFHRLGDRLSRLKPTVLNRRPGLQDLLLLSLAKQGEILHTQNEFEQAAQIYRRLIEIAPERRDTWQRRLALVSIDMGQIEAGLDELRAQAVAHPGDHELWLAIGLECEALGRVDEAEENLQRAARSAADPEDKNDAYLALFDFYRGQERVEEALTAWKQAWEAHGHQPDYVFPLYQMMWEIGDLKRAYEYLSQEKNPLRKGFHQGLLAVSEGKAEEASRHWRRVAKRDPLEFETGHEAWAEAALRVNHPPEEVIAALGVILDSGNLTQRVLLLQAIAEARIGHTEHAQDMLEVARKIRLRTRPRQEKLSATDWALLNELVANKDITRQLQQYFDVGSNSEVRASQEQDM